MPEGSEEVCVREYCCPSVSGVGVLGVCWMPEQGVNVFLAFLCTYDLPFGSIKTGVFDTQAPK